MKPHAILEKDNTMHFISAALTKPWSTVSIATENRTSVGMV